MAPPPTNGNRPIELDGRTGEGGGQLCRVAVALGALTTTSLVITHVRGNRSGGGGLKNQHVAAIEWLAQATQADVDGLSVGSKKLTFMPRVPPSSLAQRKISIVPGSPVASAMLVFQALLPFLLFAGGNKEGGEPEPDAAEPEPIELDIRAGTNTSMSLSYEYADQVLLPVLRERYGIRVDRTLHERGWSLGPASRGHVTFKVYPVGRGSTLRLANPEKHLADPNDYVVSTIDFSIIAPQTILDELLTALVRDVNTLFPDVEINNKILEDSLHDSRVYVLLVARSKSGLRWGRDILYSIPKKGKSGKGKGKGSKKAASTSPCDDVSRTVTKGLVEEVGCMAQCDEHLQDQLVVFQAVAEGLSSFPRGERTLGELGDNSTKHMRREKAHEPFGEGSLHAKTARWVAAEVLPGVKFYNKGLVVEGAGISF